MYVQISNRTHARACAGQCSHGCHYCGRWWLRGLCMTHELASADSSRRSGGGIAPGGGEVRGRLTEDMAGLIDPADPADPIAAQFVPSAAELDAAADDRPDPIGDERWSPLPGIVHRYPDRVLLKPILVCPVYCRFCFRREQVGPGRAACCAPAALERRLRLYPRASRNLGGDRHRRRPVPAVAAPARRDRPRASKRSRMSR